MVIHAQNFNVTYEIGMQSGLSSKTTLPFWLSSNRFGTIPDSDYVLLNTSLYGSFENPDKFFDFSYKINTTGYGAIENKVLLNELYFSARLGHVLVDLGSKNNDRLWQNLSSSNGNILNSNNARAMPGINIKTNGYVSVPFIAKWFAFKGNFAHYVLNDNRAVKGAYLHNKSLFFKFFFSKKFELIGGMEHYAQWGGISEVYGAQPSSFSDFIRIVFGSGGGNNAEEFDQINALGNHLGTYLVQFNYHGNTSDISFYYSHPFEDGSGRDMNNWRDGLYGLFVDFKKPNGIVSHLLGEFTYTKHMSGSAHSLLNEDGNYNIIGGQDNYFNHGLYTSGWTYYGKTIGSPYFTATPINENGYSSGIILGDNRFMAFNVGVAGNLYPIQYKVLLSHTTYYGWFDAEYNPYPIQFSGLLEMHLPESQGVFPFDVSVSTSFDTGTYRPVNFGAFISIKKAGVF